MNVKCGHCPKSHTSIAVVRACSQGNVFTCHWLVERLADGHPEDAPEMIATACGADAVGDESGWTCASGHSNVAIQPPHEQGRDHADEADRATVIDVEPVLTASSVSRMTDTAMNPSREYRLERARGANTAWGAVRELHRAYND